MDSLRLVPGHGFLPPYLPSLVEEAVIQVHDAYSIALGRFPFRLFLCRQLPFFRAKDRDARLSDRYIWAGNVLQVLLGQDCSLVLNGSWRTSGGAGAGAGFRESRVIPVETRVSRGWDCI